MNYRKIIYVVILYVYFCLYWLYVNRNCLPDINEAGIQGLLDLVTSYAGYNAIVLHGTVYPLFYIFMLNEYLPKINVQYLLRMKRTTFIYKSAQKIFLSSLVYTFIFISTETALVTIFVNHQFLIRSNYYFGIILSVLLTVLYYIFVGSLFLLNTILFSKTKAFIVSFIMLTLFVNYQRILNLPKFWLPVEVIVVFDFLFKNKLHLINVCLDAVKIIVLTAFIYFLAVSIFKDKDVLNENI